MQPSCEEVNEKKEAVLEVHGGRMKKQWTSVETQESLIRYKEKPFYCDKSQAVGQLAQGGCANSILGYFQVPAG